MTALTSPITGSGTTVSGLGQTTFLKKISGLADNIGTFDISILATTGYKKVKKLDLADNPKVTVECFHIGNAFTLGATGTFTITWPAAGSFAGTGIVTNIKYPDAEIGSGMMCSYEITYDGATGPAYTAA
tara:strand:+ start:62 stop:451 length:390 start_codon:yes stop_codon:yes gene_type:complete